MNTATVRQLEYFIAACETGSVSAAAVRCSAAQASVTTALNDLERTLGVQLLIRTPSKGVQITNAGRRALPLARHVLQGTTELSQLAWEEAHEVSGPLNIGCATVLSPRVLPAIADAFDTRHPNVTLRFFDGMAAEVQELLAERMIDCCLLYARQVNADFDTHPVRTLSPYAVLAIDHPLAREAEVHLSDLREDRLILVQPSGSRDVIQKLLADAGVTPRVGWEFQNPETVRAMVARGLGYSVFSGKPAGTETFDGRRVAYVPVADRVNANEVVLALPAGTQINARLRTLTEILAEPETLRSFG